MRMRTCVTKKKKNQKTALHLPAKERNYYTSKSKAVETREIAGYIYCKLVPKDYCAKISASEVKTTAFLNKSLSEANVKWLLW